MKDRALLTRLAAPRPAFGGGIKNRRSGSTLSKPWSSGRGVEGLTPRVAVGAVVMKENKILLVKRRKEPSKGDWAIPGGSVKLGETLQEAAEREMKEETGLIIKAKDPIYSFDLIERDERGQIRFHYVIIDLIADFIRGEPSPSDDAVDARWFTSKGLEGVKVNERTKDLLKKIKFT